MKLMVKNFVLLIVFMFSAPVFLQAQNNGDKIKIACVGNSVTYGYGIENRELFSYPAQLQELLGDDYEVRNFGFSGATLLSKGHKPYINTQEYQQALLYQADIVIIDLGLNDTDPRNWPNYRDEFIPDYHRLIASFAKPSGKKPRIYICSMTPIFHGHSRFKSGTRDWFWQIQASIEKVAKYTQSRLIDLHTPLYSRPDLFEDALHPDAEGASIIARTLYSAITGDFGGFTLAPVFGEHMVLQQKLPIAFFGTANAGDKIEIRFSGISQECITNHNGKWEIVFPAMQAGGPVSLRIDVNDSLSIDWKDIMIGEVWLCSGQSNMEFQLHRSQGGRAEASVSKGCDMRLLHFKPLAHPLDFPWDSVTLKKTNQLQFFEHKWAVSDSTSAADFSAIGYYFGKELRKNLNVPVGIILISYGGAPTEAFIDRRSLEHHPVLVDMLNNWYENDFVMDWVRNRAARNISTAPRNLQRHPYLPAYLFEAGIAQLKGIHFQGVLWYQGESNAHNIEHHEVAFKALVASWRRNFGNPEMPVFFAQLSSIGNRPSWTRFRDSQRRLALEISNSGMVVTSDIGDSLDVHPIRKKEVAERFAGLALNKVYGKKPACEFPDPVDATIKNQEVIVRFSHTKKLLTSDQLPVRELEMAADNGNFYAVEGRIKGKKIVIPFTGKTPAIVRYGWYPYSQGNLVNEAGLPASTFEIEIR